MSRDPHEYVGCGLCGADNPTLLFGTHQIPGGKIGGVVRCRVCGLIYRNIRHKETDLRGYYAQWYDAALAPERIAGRKELFAKCLKLAEPFRQCNRILDVGAGHGFFLRACADRGWDCYGVEISRPAVDFAQRNFGLRLACGAFEKTEYPAGFFDAVTFFNSLEFLPDPKGALQKTYRLLRPGGAVIVRFSNAFFHVAAYRFFLFWSRIHPRLNRMDQAVIHLYAFDKNSITRMLLESGFTGMNVACMPLSWLTKNDVQTGFAKQLACKLLHPLASFCALITFGNLLIAPSLAVIARKGNCSVTRLEEFNLNNVNPKQPGRQIIPEILRPPGCVGNGRIVLVTTGGLGDTIVFSPVFRAARRTFPRAEIILAAASPLVQDLYSSALELDRIDVIDTNRKLSPALYARLWRLGVKCRQGQGIDLLVCASRLSPWLIRLFTVVCNPRAISAMAFPPDHLSDLEVNTALARRLAPDISTTDAFAPVTAASTGRMESRLRERYGLADAGRLVAVYPSVVKPNRPCWSLPRLVMVTARIAGLINGQVIVVGGALEGQACQVICRANKGILNLAGVLTVPETAALLAQVRLAICNDGGIMHLAGAVGCPMVAIMSGVARDHRPPGEFVRVLTPCVIEGVAGEIESIAEQTVYQAAAELLDATAVLRGK